MTNAKVKVSKEVAEAIEQLRKGKSDDEIFYHATSLILHRDRFNRKNKNAITALHGIPPLKLATVLATGYEIEASAEEIVNKRIKDMLATTVNFSDEKRILDAEMRGIKLVVDAFKIEGVNV